MPRTVLLINLDPSRKFGGFEEEVLQLARAFQSEGSLLRPVYTQPLGPTALRAYEALRVTADVLDLNSFTWERFRALRERIVRDRIELVNWHFYEPIRNPYLWALRLWRPGLCQVYTDHISRPAQAEGAIGRARRACKRSLLRAYAAALCVSDFVQAQLQAQETWPRLVRVSHFVNTERFAPGGEMRGIVRDTYEVGARFVALVIAHLIPAKGVDAALQALARLPETVNLWVIGDGPEAASLAALAAGLGVSERTRFLGIQADVGPFLQAADCLVCPSIWAEAAGLVNLEALAQGLPIVASRIGGIPEFVDHETTGLLVPPGDVEALAGAIRRLHDDPALRDRMAREARVEALSRFSTEAVLPGYLDVYRSLRPWGPPTADTQPRRPRAEPCAPVPPG